jgi:hypothetical protein
MDSLLPFLQGLAPLQHAGFIPALNEYAVIRDLFRREVQSSYSREQAPTAKLTDYLD